MASAACAWGFSYIFMKWGLDSCTPFQVIFFRFGIAFPLLLLVFWKKAIPRKVELAWPYWFGGGVQRLRLYRPDGGSKERLPGTGGLPLRLGTGVLLYSGLSLLR